ncbi:hypothetical protein IAU60_003038 [Kwoniella sp. DSM 27419]
MSLRTALTAAWAALHTAQYGFAISGLNGIQSPLTCGGAGGVGSHLTRSGWLKPCVAMTRFGRVGTLRMSAVAVLVGSAGVGLSNSVGAMIAARVVIGLGCGLATVTVPLFLSEVAPPALKRSLGIMNQIFIVIGMLISQSLSFPFAKAMTWRWVLSVSVGIAVVQLAASVLVREPEETSTEDENASLLGGETEALSIKQLLTTKNPQVTRGLMYFSTRILTPVFQSNSRLIALFIVITKLPITTIPAFLIEALSVIAVFSFVIAFSVGLGPVTWVVLPEVMPKRAVTAAGSVGIALNWTANFCMGAAFLPLQQWMSGGEESGEGNVFFVLAGTCLVAAFAMRAAFGIRDRVALE